MSMQPSKNIFEGLEFRSKVVSLYEIFFFLLRNLENKLVFLHFSGA